MKKYFVYSVAAMCGMMALCGCQSDVLNVGEQELAEPTSVLTVSTRGDADGLTIEVPEPVRLYLFKGDNCTAVVPDVSQTPTIRLQGGTYDVYAIAGADPTRYDCPEEDVEKTSLMTLLDGKTLGDLMVADAQVTVADAARYNLTLSMNRVVMGVKQMTIKKVPDGMTAVTVTISPLYESLAVNGSTSGTGGSYTASLTKNADNTTWTLFDEPAEDISVFLFPSVGCPTITVGFTSSEGTVNYSYSTTEPLTANHKIDIEGTYTEQATLQLTGTITGSEWDTDQAITFDFNETNASSSGDNTGGGETGGETGGESGGENTGGDNTGGDNTGGDQGGSTSQSIIVGTLYNNCYVLKVEEGHALLLSPTGKVVNSSATSNSVTLTKIDSELENWTVSDVSGTWRMPDLEEITDILINRNTINALVTEDVLSDTSGSYYYFDGENLKQASIIEASNMIKTDQPANFGPRVILRPVLVIDVPNS